MTGPKVVFLFDVDNTLLDNDRVTDDLKRHLEETVGHARQEDYWAIFERLRTELGYADYLGVLQRYRVEHPRDSQVLTVARFLLNYPFAKRVFPLALDVVRQVQQWGTAVILSDGDVVFQPWKIERSGLFKVMESHVLIYIHKEQELEDVERRYPAQHYVVIDDKLRILTAVKQVWGARVTTVFPRQGHYAHDQEVVRHYLPPDVTIERIGDLLAQDLDWLLEAASPLPVA